MATAITAQSAENRRYVRKLLRQQEPVFSAALELAIELVAREEGINSLASSPRSALSERVRKLVQAVGAATHPLSCVPVAVWLPEAVISRSGRQRNGWLRNGTGQR
jgi:hypothetical protein